MQAKSHFEGWYFQDSQFDFPVAGLREPLLHDRNSSPASGLVIYSKISHDWFDRWFVVFEQSSEFPVGGLVGSNEGSLFWIDL